MSAVVESFRVEELSRRGSWYVRWAYPSMTEAVAAAKRFERKTSPTNLRVVHTIEETKVVWSNQSVPL